jgi:hypothetical protein
LITTPAVRLQNMSRHLTPNELKSAGTVKWPKQCFASGCLFPAIFPLQSPLFTALLVLLPAGAAVRFFRTGNLGKPVFCIAKVLCFVAMQPDCSSDDSALSYRESSSGSHEDLVVMSSAVAATHHYWNTIEKENDALASRCAGGSRPGKGRNRNRGGAEGAFRIDRDYL